MSWTDAEFGAAWRAALMASVAVRGAGPTLVREIGNYRATVTIITGRRFRDHVEAEDASPIVALRLLAERLATYQVRGSEW